MSESVPHENIVLIGFMGSGKSSVGRRLAVATQRKFVDTDRLVVDRAGMPIPAIFEKYGESYFRELESDALAFAVQSPGGVIATGGGIVLRPENRELLRNLSKVVLLTATVEVIFERVSRRSNRPLLQTANPRETIEKLIAERQPLYEKTAKVIIDTTKLNHDQVAELVLSRIGEN